MEQPCYKCGQAIEEGTPFCPHCAAPQIRVVAPEPPAAAADSSGQIAVAESTSPVAVADSPIAIPMRAAHLAKPGALAALVASILVLLGLNLLVAMIGAGSLAVVFYRQKMHGLALKPGTGARLGAFAGLFFSLWLGIVGTLGGIVEGQKIHQEIIDNAQKWVAARPADPQLQAALDQLKTPSGFALAMVLACALLFVISVMLSSLGGLLLASILGKAEKR